MLSLTLDSCYSLFLSTLLSVRAVLLSLMDDGILQYDEDNYMKSRCHQCQAGYGGGAGVHGLNSTSYLGEMQLSGPRCRLCRANDLNLNVNVNLT